MSKRTPTPEQLARLTPEQRRIALDEGTERAWTGPWLDEKRRGDYLCAVCGSTLWRSQTKYESGSGWPSFTAPASADAVETKTDYAIGVARTEVHCATCGAHMGHVFPDGPGPSGLRYCINGGVLDFKPEDDGSTS